MNDASVDIVEQTLRQLLSGEHSSLTLSFNDEFAANYCTAHEWPERCPEFLDEDTWVSEHERNVALENNTVWAIQWYPNTPVGFNILRASNLASLFEALAGDDT